MFCLKIVLSIIKDITSSLTIKTVRSFPFLNASMNWSLGSSLDCSIYIMRLCFDAMLPFDLSYASPLCLDLVPLLSESSLSKKEPVIHLATICLGAISFSSSISLIWLMMLFTLYESILEASLLESIFCFISSGIRDKFKPFFLKS
jgi:hypothetical protein